jgi:hypothetical protein
MNRRIAWVVGASLLVGSAVFAQSNGPAATLDIEDETPISLVGCIQRETEYRRQNDSGKGGFLGFGGGLGDEYVLVNASRGFPGVDGDCTTATGGDAFELKGSAEEDLEAFVGQRVAISGMLDEADVPGNRTPDGRTTGGRRSQALRSGDRIGTAARAGAGAGAGGPEFRHRDRAAAGRHVRPGRCARRRR